MKKNKNDIVDDLLKIGFIEQDHSGLQRELMNHLPSDIKMSDKQKQMLFQRLADLEALSLGALLKQKMEALKLDLSILSHKVSISMEKLSQLIEDNAVAYIIPAEKMYQLLTTLNLSVGQAKPAILVTSALLKNNNSVNDSLFSDESENYFSEDSTEDQNDNHINAYLNELEKLDD